MAKSNDRCCSDLDAVDLNSFAVFNLMTTSAFTSKINACTRQSCRLLLAAWSAFRCHRYISAPRMHIHMRLSAHARRTHTHTHIQANAAVHRNAAESGWTAGGLLATVHTRTRSNLTKISRNQEDKTGGLSGVRKLDIRGALPTLDPISKLRLSPRINNVR